MKRFLILTLSILCLASYAQPITALNPDVKQDTIAQTICVSGYTKTVRPATVYTNDVKKKLMREQGIDWKSRADYELDHIIPLALGGHPRSLDNLVLQHWEGTDGAKRKDKLEVKLQCLVCTGTLLLDDARADIYQDWRAAADKYLGKRCSKPRGVNLRD
jgi:hypothetical protein